MTTKQLRAMQEAKKNTYPKKRPVTGIRPGLPEHGRRAKRPLIGKKLG